MEQKYLIDLDDAIAVTRNENGAVRFDQNVDYEGEGIGWGLLWGTLVGSLLALPFTAGTSAAAGAAVLLGGGAAGGALGAVGGAIDGNAVQEAVGFDMGFVNDVTYMLKPGTSAIMALIRTGAPDKVAEQLSQHGGKVLKTTLTDEQDKKLQRILDHKKA